MVTFSRQSAQEVRYVSFLSFWRVPNPLPPPPIFVVPNVWKPDGHQTPPSARSPGRRGRLGQGLDGRRVRRRLRAGHRGERRAAFGLCQAVLVWLCDWITLYSSANPAGPIQNNVPVHRVVDVKRDVPAKLTG